MKGISVVICLKTGFSVCCFYKFYITFAFLTRNLHIIVGFILMAIKGIKEVERTRKFFFANCQVCLFVICTILYRFHWINISTLIFHNNCLQFNRFTTNILERYKRWMIHQWLWWFAKIMAGSFLLIILSFKRDKNPVKCF